MKKIWLIINAILLATSAFSFFAGAENLFGVSVTLITILSFPLNLLVGWLFFAYGGPPVLMLLMAFVMSVVGYVQWFELVPRIAKYFGRKLGKHDLQIELTATRAETKQIEEGPIPEATDWQTNWYEKEKYSPVERVFSQDQN
jgi:hypothetical protein